MWNITLLNKQCPFAGTVKESDSDNYPCSHELNHRHGCSKLWCPLIQFFYTHMDSKDCWCNPKLEYVDPETGAEVWVHNQIQ